MLRNRAFIKCVIFVLALLFWAGAAQAVSWNITQLTDNSRNDGDPQISGTNVVWYGHDGSDNEIFFWDGNSITPATDNVYNDQAPQISGSNVVWRCYDGDWEIFFWHPSMSDPCQLTDNSNADYSPQISGTNVVWEGYDGSDYEIFFWNPSMADPCQVTDNGYNDHAPQISGSKVVWRGDDVDWEIFFWDPSMSDPCQLTDNSNPDWTPQISGTNVVWEGYDGSDYEIFVWDWISMGDPCQVTDNGYNDQAPQISGSNLVWNLYDGDWEIFFWDPSMGDPCQLTDNSYIDYGPQISGTNVAWFGYDGSDREIFFWNPSMAEPCQVTDNGADDEYPQISGRNVVWYGYDGSDNEIFMATALAVCYYVDANATGANDGSSWANAYNYLQDALADPNLFGPAEIWVAEGTYYPDQGGGQTPGDREATFQLISDVAVYGGFPSGGGNWGDRDPNAYETILSGDLNNNDEPNWVNCTENTYHVVTGSGTDANATLDGFTITAGYANGLIDPNYIGGGMYSDGGSPTVDNCIFRENFADHDGGGIAGSDGAITNCTFIGNRANDDGGGLKHCSGPVTDCLFTGNSAGQYGGAMYKCSGSITDCNIISNSADTGGGGMANGEVASPTLTNCTFIGNSAEDGGGIFNYGSSPTVTDCNFIGNLSGSGGGGGGMCNWDSSSPTLTNCTFSNNIGVHDGGGIHNLGNSNPILNNCTFIGNSVTASAVFGGGGLFNFDGSSTTLEDCTFIDNTSPKYGGGIYTGNDTVLTLTDCNITGSSALSGGGMYCDGNSLFPVVLTSVNCVIEDIAGRVDGNSIIHLGDTASISTADIFTMGGNSVIIGTGSIAIDVTGEMVFVGNTDVNLADDPCDPNNKGTILCDGLLRARHTARICNANINVTRANLLGPSPHGQFFIENAAEVVSNDINSQDDRYLDFDPNTFYGTIEDNKIHITITEGANDTPSRLLELRGQDFLAEPLCEPNEFFCEVNEVPPFDVNSWTAELVEIPAGTKVKLTNRFDFGNGGSYEVMYVKNLILGPGCELDTAFNKLYYENLEGDPNAVKNRALLGYSLGRIDIDDPNEFNIRVTHNNFIHPEEPNYTRVHVERVTGVEPDPDGMMLMRNLLDKDPCSPTDGQMINARAKGLFTKSSEDFIQIRFQYIFGTADPDLELVVYLCDVPDFLAHDDPERDNHYIEVARIPVPPPGRPGSVSSGRFAVFYRSVYRGDLNLTESTLIELELVEPQQGGPLFHGGKELKTMSSEGGSASINNMDAGVYCAWDRWFCADINFSDTVDEEDYLTVVGGYGEPEGLGSEEEGGRGCMEGPFSDNDHLDSLDIAGWDWTLDSSNRWDLCTIPLAGLGGSSTANGQSTSSGGPGPLVSLPALSDLLITGKRGTSSASNKVKDRLYIFDSNSLYVGWFVPASQRCNIKLVRGPEGELYQINAETGILRLDDTNEVIVPPSIGGIVLTEFNEPRYDEAATVYVGLQGTGANTYGRPIIDAAFDANDANYVYVVPVVVEPSTSEPYTAVAKLNLDPPPYSIIKLYDTAPSAGDREYRNSLREIELDGAGNLYLINAHAINENDMLWKFNTDTAAITGTINLGNPASQNYVPDPIGMFVSATEKIVYLASGQRNQADPNAAEIHGFSTETLTLQRSIPISGMHFATSITGDPSRGLLWVAGFDMNDLQGGSPNPYIEPFYHPYLAQIPHDVNVPDYVMSLLGSDDLALPMSIVWTGTELKCDGADLDGIGNVNFDDFAILAPQFHQAPGTPSADIGPVPGGDGIVNLVDVAVFVNHWLESGCN